MKNVIATLIQKYSETLDKYIQELENFVVNPPNSELLETSTLEDYLGFRSNSLSELLKTSKGLKTQLDKFGKLKTLDSKIIKSAKYNSLINGKFYDFAIGHYNFIDTEPELYDLIDSHFATFFQLSKELENDGTQHML
ncbi:MAG: hypothetical protein ABJG47_16375 [Ekhidna sp.]